MSYATDERRALCALLDKTGPDAPTLCEGWTTGDLAAHLVLRERRPDAAAGVAGGPLAGYTARVQQRLRDRIPFPDLVRMIRSGPPRLSVMALPGVDERANSVEYFVHHEDVRRGRARLGAAGTQPRRGRHALAPAAAGAVHAPQGAGRRRTGPGRHRGRRRRRAGPPTASRPGTPPRR